MRILGIATLIMMICCSTSSALGLDVDEANEKLQAMDRAKLCDYYKFVPQRKNDSYVTKAIVYDKYKNQLEIEGEILDYRGCIDVDGDGIPEVVITDYHRAVAGAPISLKHIYKSNKRKIELLETISGEFGEDAAFVDLNKDKKTEIVTYVVWSFWGDLTLNDSPALPRIYCYRQKEFIDCTKQFPDIIKKEIESTLKEVQDESREYAKNPGRPEEQEGFIKGRALKYLALYDSLGQEKKGWEGIKKYFPSAYQWLRKEWEH